MYEFRSTVCTYGDLEIFLSGLELGNYIQLFQRNDVTFPAFLRMTDHDLQQVNRLYLYRLRTKLREGNVFTDVCLSTGAGVGILGPFWGLVSLVPGIRGGGGVGG